MPVRLFILLIILSLLIACGNDSTTGPDDGVTPAMMLGLVDGHTLEYFQIDTTISYDYDPDISPDPVRVVTTSSRNRAINFLKDGSNWIVRDGLVPMLNLIVSGDYVLQNGFYSNYGVSDSLVYFQTPAVLMTNAFTVDKPWTYSTGQYLTTGENLTTNFYFAYFGYRAEKTYIGREEVLITAGAFNAYRFDVNLFINPLDTIPIARATEYYAPESGLVKLRFEDAGFIRTMILIEDQ